MKKIIGGLLLLLSGIAIWYAVSANLSRDLPKIEKISINNQTINVEVADTENKRISGLSGRTTLPQNQGMLFIFPHSGSYSFWMKEMHFPLDFIWINGDKIVDLTENVLPAEASLPDSQLPRYYSRFPMDKVLEMAAGTIKKLGIKIGDRIRF